MAEQLKLMPGTVFTDLRTKHEDVKPPPPWSVKQVKTMSIGQSRNVYDGLHPTGHKMGDDTHKTCGSCIMRRSSSGDCGYIKNDTHGSTRLVKVTFYSCSRYEK